jgi:hypothetical protein
MKLYKGMSRRLFKKLYRYHGGINVKRFNQIAALKVGDVIHDCDGFNHRIKSIEFFKQPIDHKMATCSNTKENEYIDRTIAETKGYPKKDITGIKPRRRGRSYICDFEVMPEDGGCFCGCGAFPEKAHSRDEIEKYVLSWDCEEGWETINQGILNGLGDSNNIKKMIEALKNGEHICDENGIRYEQFNMKEE